MSITSQINLLLTGSNDFNKSFLPGNVNIIHNETHHYIELNTDYYKDADINFFNEFAPQDSYSVGLNLKSTRDSFFINEDFQAIPIPHNNHGALHFNGLRKISGSNKMNLPPTPGEGFTIFPTPRKHLFPQKKICFLDRDGVLIEDTGYPHGIHINFLDSNLHLLEKYKKQNYEFIVITNQSGIARGYFTERDYANTNKAIEEYLSKKGFNILSWYFCPHHKSGVGEYKKESIFRKPMPGMILQACHNYSIDLSQSLMIGDKESDNIYISLKDFFLI